MANPFTAGFSKVQAAWTGAIAVSVGATTVTVTPSGFSGSGRTSAAVVVVELVNQARDIIGGTWSVYADTSGHMNIESSNSFSLVASSNTATRTGYGTHSAAYSQRTASAHPDGTYPLGLQFDAIGLSKQGGTHVLDGSGAPSTIWVSDNSTATIFDTWANTHTFASTFYPEGALVCFDIWIADHVLGRYKITGTSMSPPGMSLAYWHLDLTLQGSE